MYLANVTDEVLILEENLQDLSKSEFKLSEQKLLVKDRFYFNQKFTIR